MAKTYKTTFIVRLGNFFVINMLRAGVKMGNMALLTVPGRKSGLPRTTPISLGEQNGKRWIIAPYGAVNWVRNLRAAGKATLTRGRRVEQIEVVELSTEEAAPILKNSLGGAPSFLHPYFDVRPDSPLEDFIREAPRHPVFLVKSLSEQQGSRTSNVERNAMLS